MSREEAARAESRGDFLAAAKAYQAGGAAAEALASLTRVAASHPSYRDACRLAVGLAGATGVTLAFEQLLARFVRDGPSGPGDVGVFLELAAIYEQAGFPENALEALRKLLSFDPGHAVARARLERLSPALPDLPGLPDLPEPSATPPAPSGTPTLRDPLHPTERMEPPGSAHPFRIGNTIAGRYRIESRIGSGGMSIVLRAADLELGDAVAIKVFTQGVFDKETDERLRRELLLSRRITHRNVVRLFDLGLEQGFRYVTMELLEGGDLRSRLRGHPLPTAEAVDYLIQACHGLQAAHEQGIVHRDVKPENLFLVREGLVKVMDFGIAKLHSAPGITATGILAGTPAYIAPEQVRDFRNVSPAADIYSIGVVAYEAFTGTLPFNHPEPMQLLMMQLSDAAPPLRSRNPEVPAALDALILECLSKGPGPRPPSCAELARRLEVFAR